MTFKHTLLTAGATLVVGSALVAGGVYVFAPQMLDGLWPPSFMTTQDPGDDLASGPEVEVPAEVPQEITDTPPPESMMTEGGESLEPGNEAGPSAEPTNMEAMGDDAGCTGMRDWVGWMEDSLIETATAGISTDMAIADLGLEEKILRSGYDVLVATVESVSTRPATNGNPPRVTLRIHEVLRGDPAIDRRCARWEPADPGIDYLDESGMARLRAWREEPLSGPEVGSQMIVLGAMREYEGERLFIVPYRARYQFSEADLEIARAAVQLDAERAAEAAVQRQEYQAKLETWQNQIDSETVRQFAAEADVVARAVVRSGEDTEWIDFQVEELFKGRRKDEDPNQPYTIRVRVTAEMAEVLRHEYGDWATPYLLFLSEADALPFDTVASYDPVRFGGGVVPGSEPALEAVRSVLSW